MTIQEHQETLARERDAHAAALTRESEADTGLPAFQSMAWRYIEPATSASKETLAID
jgi:hypothetical protein